MDGLTAKYALRSIVRILNGDFKIAEELASTAEKMNSIENSWCQIGQVVSNEMKEKLYKAVEKS